MKMDENGQLEGTIGFIGSGNMAEAMISALIRTKTVLPHNILAADIQPERLTCIGDIYGVRCVRDNREILAECGMVVFAVKPQQMPGLLAALAESKAFDAVSRRLLVISIAAGIKVETFERFIYTDKTVAEQQRIPIVRVMPNTPALVGAGMCAFSANACATAADVDITRRILAAMGDVIKCDEAKMDAVTAVSGSGPAYCFYFIESMLEAGEKIGLAPEEAFQLTLSTVKGALRLIEAQGESPASLRRKVTSPGGTTEAAIRVFEDNKFKEIMISAVSSAEKRSKALSQGE